MNDVRIPLLAEQEARKAAQQAEVPDAIAELNVFRVLLRHPVLAKRVNDLLMTLLFGGRLDARLRELVIMRIGWATGSVYEWTQHWRIARQLGVSEEDLLAVRDWQGHDAWSAADRAVLAATDETLSRGAISPGTWSECAAALPGVEEQLELVGAIGTWRMISQLLRSLEVPLEDGVSPWPPDGATPPPRGV
jgi:alkylhydroperoxidase family enzyme